jgi:hypothetical protein
VGGIDRADSHATPAGRSNATAFTHMADVIDRSRQRPLKPWLIDSGYRVAACKVIGGILDPWK